MIGSDGIERIAPSKRVLPFADLYEETVRQVVPNPIGHGYLTRSAGEPEPDPEDVYQELLEAFAKANRSGRG